MILSKNIIGDLEMLLFQKVTGVTAVTLRASKHFTDLGFDWVNIFTELCRVHPQASTDYTHFACAQRIGWLLATHFSVSSLATWTGHSTQLTHISEVYFCIILPWCYNFVYAVKSSINRLQWRTKYNWQKVDSIYCNFRNTHWTR